MLPLSFVCWCKPAYTVKPVPEQRRSTVDVSIHAPQGDKRCLFGQQSDGSRKPHRKGVLLPVLTQLQQGFQSLAADG